MVLGSVEQNPWFTNLLVRLLQGSKPVLALFGTNPFPDKPPKYLRAEMYYYRFSDRDAERAWWKREYRGPYTPVVSLK